MPKSRPNFYGNPISSIDPLKSLALQNPGISIYVRKNMRHMRLTRQCHKCLNKCGSNKSTICINCALRMHRKYSNQCAQLKMFQGLEPKPKHSILRSDTRVQTVQMRTWMGFWNAFIIRLRYQIVCVILALFTFDPIQEKRTLITFKSVANFSVSIFVQNFRENTLSQKNSG